MKKFKIEFGRLISDNDEDLTIEFRLLSAQEANRLFSIIEHNEDNAYFIEEIFHLVTESKYDISTFPVGIINTTIYASLKTSGYFKDPLDLPNTIDSNREKVKSSTFYLIYSEISKILPSYKLEELKLKSSNELIELFAYAELVAGTPLFDTEKLRKALEAEANPKSVSAKTGVAGVTQDELDLLKGILDQEEFQSQGMWNY